MEAIIHTGVGTSEYLKAFESRRVGYLIQNLKDISIDELLSNENGAKKPTDYLFESITEYDIDEKGTE